MVTCEDAVVKKFDIILSPLSSVIHHDHHQMSHSKFLNRLW